MDEKRTEAIPSCLMLLAVCALGFSWYAAVRLVPKDPSGPAASRTKPAEQPRRSLSWPVDRLDELAEVELEDLGVEPLESALTVLRVSPPEMLVEPSITPYRVSGWPQRFFPPVSLDASAAEPLEAPPMLVLLPAPARLSAAATPPREDDAWRLLGLDTLDGAKVIGSWIVSWPQQSSRLAITITRLPALIDDVSPVVQFADPEEESKPAIEEAKRTAPEIRVAQPVEPSPVIADAPVTPVPEFHETEPHEPGPALREAERDEPEAEDDRFAGPAGPYDRRRLAASLISTVAPQASALLSMPSIERYLNEGAEGGVFPTPSQIGAQLARLSESPGAAGWAWAVAYRLRGVVGSAPSDETAVRRTLVSLQRASDEAAGLAEEASDERIATELRRSRFALDRRVATWSAVLRDQSAPSKEIVDQRRRDWLLGARWAMTPEGWVSWSGPRKRGDQPSASIRLAKQLEQYEAAPSGHRARAIATEAARLARTGGDTGVELASAVQQHYRNANLRVAVAADLIERLLPRTAPTTSVIRDRIAGAPVRGSSTTAARLRVVPIPADDAWRLVLRADGTVRSQTQSSGGPAVLKSRGSTRFLAEKSIFIDRRGFWAHPAQAQATASSTRLTSVSTRYDGVPVFGSYARSTARREYERRKRRAGAEVRTKVESRVRDELDTRAEAALTKLHRQYLDEVVGRLGQLDLRAEPVEMRTTETRVIGRLRIAGERQLAAHTPRMRAPSDSLLSVQLHESTLNNAIEGLALAGEKMTVEELRQRLSTRLDFAPNGEIDGESARTQIRFAQADPIRVSFEDGQARLTLAIDEMAVRGKRHRGFKVHTLYRPSTEGLRASLVQQGTAQIEGRMRSSTRLRLHAALGKVLGEDRRIPLTPSLDRLRPDVSQRLDGLTTTQLVIEDGWLGIAVAPRRPQGRVAARVGTYIR